MQDQTTSGPPSGFDGLAHTLLDLLLTDESPGLWSTEEIAVAMGDPVIAVDTVDTLRAAGLLHRHGEFVFPTRAAARYRHLEQAD